MLSEFTPTISDDDPLRLAVMHDFLRNRLVGAIRQAESCGRGAKRSQADALALLQTTYADFMSALNWCYISAGDEQVIAQAEEVRARLNR